MKYMKTFWRHILDCFLITAIWIILLSKIKKRNIIQKVTPNCNQVSVLVHISEFKTTRKCACSYYCMIQIIISFAVGLSQKTNHKLFPWGNYILATLFPVTVFPGICREILSRTLIRFLTHYWDWRLSYIRVLLYLWVRESVH